MDKTEGGAGRIGKELTDKFAEEDPFKGAHGVFKIDPEWLKEDFLAQKRSKFTDTVYPSNTGTGMVRVGEQRDDWHDDRPNFKGGHLVYHMHPDMEFGLG